MKNVADFRKMFFAYKLLTNIEAIEKTKHHNFGASMKYGKMAVIAAIGTSGISDDDIDVESIDNLAKEKIKGVESLWGEFIKYIAERPENKPYLIEHTVGYSLDYDVYYKGRTVNSNIKSFFKK